MTIKYRLSLILAGFDESPETFARSLQIVPDALWRKGDRRLPRAFVTHKENGVEIVSGAAENAPPSAQIAALIAKLQPINMDAVLATKQRCFAFKIDVYGDDRPELYLSQQDIAAISRFDADVDFDLILYPERDTLLI